MPIIQCPIDGCAYVTNDVDTAIAAALLMVHWEYQIGKYSLMHLQKPL